MTSPERRLDALLGGPQRLDLEQQVSEPVLEPPGSCPAGGRSGAGSDAHDAPGVGAAYLEMPYFLAEGRDGEDFHGPVLDRDFARLKYRWASCYQVKPGYEPAA